MTPLNAPPDLHEALWTAVLAKVDEVARHGNRGYGYFTRDGREALTIAEKHQPDGTYNVYEITATASRDGSITTRVKESVRVGHEFWRPIAENSDRSQRVVIGDRCYTICPDDPRPGPGSGFDGRQFVIEWLDDAGQPTGEATTTRNLWSRGIVPPPYRDTLKPNARIAGGDR